MLHFLYIFRTRTVGVWVKPQLSFFFFLKIVCFFVFFVLFSRFQMFHSLRRCTPQEPADIHKIIPITNHPSTNLHDVGL